MLRITPASTGAPRAPSQLRLCIHCRHARKLDVPYSNDLGCNLFKSVNVVTGTEKLDLAIVLRNDSNACGLEGKLFEPRVSSPPLPSSSSSFPSSSQRPPPSPDSSYFTNEGRTER